MAAAAQQGAKQVLIVEGGPGTGKSVVAINLLVALTGRELVAQYVTRNAAPRAVFQAKLAGTLATRLVGSILDEGRARRASIHRSADRGDEVT